MPFHKKKFNDQQFNSLLREKKNLHMEEYASLFVHRKHTTCFWFHVLFPRTILKYLFYPAEIIHIHNLFLTAFIKVCIEKSRVCIIMNFIWPDFVILKKLISIRSCCGPAHHFSLCLLWTWRGTAELSGPWLELDIIVYTRAWCHRTRARRLFRAAH